MQANGTQKIEINEAETDGTEIERTGRVRECAGPASPPARSGEDLQTSCYLRQGDAN